MMVGAQFKLERAVVLRRKLPFSVSTVSLYLFEIHQPCASSASMIQAHAALKWFHSFVPSLVRNPLDSELCKKNY